MESRAALRAPLPSPVGNFGFSLQIEFAICCAACAATLGAVGCWWSPQLDDIRAFGGGRYLLCRVFAMVEGRGSGLGGRRGFLAWSLTLCLCRCATIERIRLDSIADDVIAEAIAMTCTWCVTIIQGKFGCLSQPASRSRTLSRSSSPALEGARGRRSTYLKLWSAVLQALPICDTKA